MAARGAGQERKLPTIGFLGASTASNWTDWTAAFVNRLRELGWVEGRTVAIEYRWAEGRTERFTTIGTEFVQLKVDVIVTVGGAAKAAQKDTATIPIVAAIAKTQLGRAWRRRWPGPAVTSPICLFSPPILPENH